jgi:hypothetical protein
MRRVRTLRACRPAAAESAAVTEYTTIISDTPPVLRVIDGEMKKCVIIPVADLLVKEYETMTGFNASGYMGGTKVVKQAPEFYETTKIENGK